MRGNSNLLAYKALLRRSGNYYSVKVGLFGSSGRLGQALQGAGTAVIPGDLSEFRNPARAGIYSALVPGGLPGTRLAAPSRSGRGYRCPEGFQYGGRFTDNRFSTCGQMLFDIFTLGATVGQLRRPVGRRLNAPASGGQANIVEGISEQEQRLIISRAAQIPRVGNADAGRRNDGVRSALSALEGAEDGATLMIRRDGFGMRPVVPTAILRTVPDNRNMEGATFLTAASTPGSLGQDELGLLSNTGIAELKYVAPNGVQFSLRKTRPLTVGERRRLGRSVATTVKIDVSSDPTARLKALASDSNGAIQYSELFPGIGKPNDLIDVKINGTTRKVRRWAFETFFSDRRKRPVAKPEAAAPSTDGAIPQRITSLAEAVKFLDGGGDPSRVLPSILSQAMQRTRSFQTRRIDNFTKMHTRSGGVSIRETASREDFEHVGAKFTSDIQRMIGLETGNVFFGGDGRRRQYFRAMSGTGQDGIQLKPADNLDNIDPAEMLKLAVADWLTDTRERSDNDLVVALKGSVTTAVDMNNRSSGLVGISRPEQSRRQALKIDEFLNEERSAFYERAFKKLTAQQRRSIVTQLDSMIQRVSGFSWEEYLARLNADGNLSAAEQSHLRIIRRIFDTRLNALKNSKESFVKLIGLVA